MPGVLRYLLVVGVLLTVSDPVQADLETLGVLKVSESQAVVLLLERRVAVHADGQGFLYQS